MGSRIRLDGFSKEGCLVLENLYLMIDWMCVGEEG